jgi:molecular chaperone HtpG
VADKLSELFRKDRKAYEEKWNDIGPVCEIRLYSDEKFYDRAKDFVLLTNTKSEHFTLEEYGDKVKAAQTDKEGRLVYLYTADAEKQDDVIYTRLKQARLRCAAV